MLTHADLVQRAVRWLMNTRRCVTVITEMASASREHPDAIGWQGSCAHSTLVECKTSRGDFQADKDKHFRRDPRQAMGNTRWYMTPPGLVKPEDVPEGWGLIEAHPTCVRIVREAVTCKVTDRAYEVQLLVSALRRTCRPGVEGVCCRVYQHTAGEARAAIHVETPPCAGLPIDRSVEVAS